METTLQVIAVVLVTVFTLFYLYPYIKTQVHYFKLIRIVKKMIKESEGTTEERKDRLKKILEDIVDGRNNEEI